jgi:hypothetical protein
MRQSRAWNIEGEDGTRYEYVAASGRVYWPVFREVGRWGSAHGRFRIMMARFYRPTEPLFALVWDDDEEPAAILTKAEARYLADILTRAR